jgi:hypothetical protein
MAQQVGVDIQARTVAAQKELQSFGKFLDSLSKRWESTFGGKGNRQASGTVQQLSRGLTELGRAADRSNTRLQAINQTLEQVVKKREALEKIASHAGADSAIAKQLKALQDQEKSLQRQQRSWTTISTIRGQMAQNAGLVAGPNGCSLPPGTPGTVAGSGSGTGQPRMNRFGGHLGDFAKTVGGGVLGPLATLGIGAGVGYVLVKAFTEALNDEKQKADLLPRFSPGNVGGTNTGAMGNRLRGVGVPFGYTGTETYQIMEALSAGGGSLANVKGDSRAVMQMARMFGIDAGGVQQALHAVGIALADLLGHLPGVAPLHGGKQPGEVTRQPHAHLRPGKVACDALTDGMQFHLPPIQDGGGSRVGGSDNVLPTHFLAPPCLSYQEVRL